MFPGEIGTTSIYNLAWSPKGDEIRFNLRTPTASGIIWLLPRRTAPDIPLVGRGAYPGWSPDSSRIALRNPGGSSVYLGTIAADGSDEQVLVLEYTDGKPEGCKPRS